MLLYLWLATICCWLIRLKVVNVFVVAASDADDVVAGAVAAVVAIAVVAFHGDYILLTMLLLLLMRNIYVIFEYLSVDDPTSFIWLVHDLYVLFSLFLKSIV